MEYWFLLLDKKGANKRKSSEIYALVKIIKGLEPLGEWNQGLLSTSYQWSRGIRERGQKENGFEISVSKTINVPLLVLYNSVVDNKLRRNWLKEKIIIRKSTENKSARITWSDNITTLSIDFYEKNETKAQVVVQHLKIASLSAASELKEFWTSRLNHLKELLEK